MGLLGFHPPFFRKHPPPLQRFHPRSRSHLLQQDQWLRQHLRAARAEKSEKHHGCFFANFLSQKFPPFWLMHLFGNLLCVWGEFFLLNFFKGTFFGKVGEVGISCSWCIFFLDKIWRIFWHSLYLANVRRRVFTSP